MKDQLSVLRDPRARAYLTEVHAAVAAVDPAAADGIMREIADHLREAAAEPGFDLDRTLTDLGDPALIAAGVEPAAAAASSAPGASPRFADSAAGVVVTVLALTVGTWWMLLVGWLVGLTLLWSSRRFSRSDKIVGTAAWPFAILAGLTLTAVGGSSANPLPWGAGFAALIVLPLLAGAYLLVRGLSTRGRSEPERMPVIARSGRGAWLETPLVAALALGGIALASASFVALAALAVRSEQVYGFLVAAELALVLAGCLVWISRSWRDGDKTLVTLLFVLAGGGMAFAVNAALDAGRTVTACTADGCRAWTLVEPSALVGIVGQLALPTLTAAAVILGVGFRAAAAADRWRPTRAQAFGVVAAMTVGGVGFVLLVLSQMLASGALLAGAAALLAVWAAAIIAQWRAEGWMPVDRAAAALVLPVLAAIPLVLPWEYTATSAVDGGVRPASSFDLGLVWGVFGVASAILALWLVVRFVPAGGEQPDARGRAPRPDAEVGVSARLVGVVGFLLVVAYATTAALQILVWNPLAAAPGESLDEIYAHLAAVGEDFSVPTVLGYLAIGPLLALAPLILSWRRGAGVRGIVTAYCGILAAGALGYFMASFGPGMSLADAYDISGGDHAPFGLVLAIVSAVALVAGVVIGIPMARRTEERISTR